MDTSDRASVDHQGLEVIGIDECWQLVAGTPVGRVAFVDGGEPMVLPVNHAVVGHRVVFRTFRGSLLHEALMSEPVAFQVDDFDPEERTGWSVVVRGIAEVADDTDELDALGLEPWADSVARDDWVQIRAEEVTGRRILHEG